MFTGLMQFLASAFNKLIGIPKTLLEAIWRSFLALLDLLLTVVVAFISGVFILLTKLFELGVGVFAAILPDAPTVNGSTSFSAIASANQYVPLAEAVALFAVFALILAIVGVYKLSKWVLPWAS